MNQKDQTFSGRIICEKSTGRGQIRSNRARGFSVIHWAVKIRRTKSGSPYQFRAA
jgi:hypothetical protein